jgi:hypothetical protein
METQQDNNTLTFTSDIYDLRVLRNQIQTYLTKNATGVGPTVCDPENSRMVSYMLVGSQVQLFSYREPEAEELTLLEVEVLSDDEGTKRNLLSKLKEVAIN